MRRFAWQWLVISSVLIVGVAAIAETRPQYGGTLHVAMRAAPTSLDPADEGQGDSTGQRTITSLIFDTLIGREATGSLEGALAESWQVSRGNRQWQLHLRPGVRFQDGAPLTYEIAAASLRRANPSWNVRAEGDSLVIESDTPDPDLIEKLTLLRNAIVKKDADNRITGTGPFQIVDWQPGRRLILAAEEDCWRGRPFLDNIEIELGKTFRDQVTSLETAKTELAEIAPEQMRQVPQNRYHVARSAPIELLALLFTHPFSNDDDKALREAFRLSIERRSIYSVLLQGIGEPSAALLSTWISGYGFVFSQDENLVKARELRSQVRAVPTWNLGYEAADPLARLVAERVALNAKDAGLSLRPAASGLAEVKLIRIPLASSSPWIAFENLIADIGLPAPDGKGRSMQDLYGAEQTILASERIVPLFHLPVAYASSVRCKDWLVRTDGSLDLANSWLDSAPQP